MRHDEDFFVGYLPTPPRLKRFALSVSVGLIALSITAASLIALAQRDPGPGRWSLDQVVTLSGRLRADPAPTLLTRDDAGRLRTLLIVEEGKFGAERLRPLDGQPARLTGTLIQRGDRMMLELSAGEQAIQPLVTDGPSIPWPSPVEQIGPATLEGHIVDPKCYLGAMKPGDGKPHKACATLCIQGGIPPMFRSTTPDGRAALYLLADERGGAVNESVLPYVADDVRVSGRIERRDDMLIFRIDPATIMRR
jgi:hypothetical protein